MNPEQLEKSLYDLFSEIYFLNLYISKLVGPDNLIVHSSI